MAIVVLLCSQITLLRYSEGTPDLSLQHFPDSVRFTFEKSTGEKLHKLYFTSGNNITNVRVNFTELQSEDDYSFIPSGVFTILEHTPFNVTSGQVSELTIKAKLNDNYTASTYVGRLTLLYSNMTIDIGTEIKLIENAIAFDVITARPPSIKFVFNEQNPRVNYIDLDITTNKTLKNIKHEFTELRNENGTTISPTVFGLKLKTEPFGVARGNVSAVTVTMDLGGEVYPPGSYEGDLKLSSAGILTRVPITVQIDPPAIWHVPYVIGLVIVGIVLSILLILAREGMRIKSSVKDSAQKAYDSLTAAVNDGRMSQGEIQKGLSSFQLGVIEIRDGNRYSDAVAQFTKAKEFFDKANSAGDLIDTIEMPSIKDVHAKIDESTLEGLAVTFQGDRLMVIGFSIVAAVVILTTLQAVSPDLLVIDSIADVVGAILFGFGSPAIANQLVPLFKKSNDS